MKNCKLSKDEQQRRKELATHVREMICEQMPVEAQDTEITICKSLSLICIR